MPHVQLQLTEYTRVPSKKAQPNLQQALHVVPYVNCLAVHDKLKKAVSLILLLMPTFRNYEF